MAASGSLLRKDITGFVVLLAFFVFAALILTSKESQNPRIVGMEAARDPSLDNTRSSGSRGFYEWTSKLGYRTQAWHHDFRDVPSSAAVMVCIAPNVRVGPGIFGAAAPQPSDGDGSESSQPNTLTAAEGRSLRAWLSQGRTLLLFASSLPGSKQTSKPGDTDAETSFASEIGVTPQSALGPSEARRDFTPLQPTPWTSGVTAIRIHSGFRLFRATDDAVVLFGDVLTTPVRKAAGLVKLAPATQHAQAVAITYPVGRGRVIAVADDFFACNANLMRVDNARFLYRILTQSASPGATVLFDEYHRDIGGESPSLWAALGRATQFGILQLLLAAIVGLVVLMPRLGRPEPLHRRTGRTSAEYVTSLAGLYQSAGATGTALDTVYRQFLRELCQKFGLPTDTTLARLADIVSRRGGVDGARLRKLLVSCEQALEQRTPVSERDLITLVRAIERVRKELGIG